MQGLAAVAADIHQLDQVFIVGAVVVGGVANKQCPAETLIADHVEIGINHRGIADNLIEQFCQAGRMTGGDGTAGQQIEKRHPPGLVVGIDAEVHATDQGEDGIQLVGGDADALNVSCKRINNVVECLVRIQLLHHPLIEGCQQGVGPAEVIHDSALGDLPLPLGPGLIQLGQPQGRTLVHTDKFDGHGHGIVHPVAVATGIPVGAAPAKVSGFVGVLIALNHAQHDL